jgi:hypothetical protein
MRTRIFAATVLTFWTAWTGLPVDTDLATRFESPPDAVRPWVYWFIMDGNFSSEGVTADLEAMKRVGIGGAILMEVDVGIPRGPVKFMSEEWRRIFKHAVREAERLGLELILNAGPGWTGSGGPWVRPEQSMQLLVASATDVSGPSRFDAVLPRPQPRKPYFGEKGLPPELVGTMQAFYLDVAALAVPKTPAGLIADLDEKALYLRHPYSSRPGTKPYLPAPTGHPILAADSTIARNRVIDLTGRMQSNGALNWDVPPGDWTILRFGRTSSGANTRPAPLPGLGLECDKFDAGALDAHFRDFIGVLLGDLASQPARRDSGWTMLHIDSWEMGAQNWSGNFREEFRRRRGYDPLPFLPSYTGRIVESAEITERFLWDMRLTSQELVVENHARHLAELAHRNGFGLSIEPYDMNPTADLALGAEADVPMCEFWAAGDGFETSFSCVEAVSIAHTNGRAVIGAEAFTGAGGSSWARHPGSMKNQADWALCAGINRIVFHRYAHQPWLDRAPGMTMGPYGTQYERTQTWWDFSRPWHDYLARCQLLLRQGLPVADVLFLTPEGAPHVFRPPASALTGSREMPDRRGYNFDACDPRTLMSRASVKDGRVAFPDGMTYRILVLPDTETMTPELLRKLRALLDEGAVILGGRPQKSPSLTGYPMCDGDVKRLADSIWGPGPEPAFTLGRRIGKGLIFAAQRGAPGAADPAFPPLYGDFSEVEALLSGLRVEPDFRSDSGLRYIHRREGNTDIYFVSNPDSRSVVARCTFRITAEKAELWDAASGRRFAAEISVGERGTTLSLPLEPHGSVFVVFTPQKAGPVVPRATVAANPVLEGGVEIPGPWSVRFQPGRGAPPSIELALLADLSRHLEPGVRHFSGTATYTTSFMLPPLGEKPRRFFIDLGQVEVAARVRLNGKDLGIAWRTPYRVEASGALEGGRNTLEIEVVNLWQNRLIGDQNLPPQSRLAWTVWNPFKADSPIPPSGLIGPVRLRPAR